MSKISYLVMTFLGTVLFGRVAAKFAVRQRAQHANGSTTSKQQHAGVASNDPRLSKSTVFDDFAPHLPSVWQILNDVEQHSISIDDGYRLIKAHIRAARAAAPAR
ncbi:hypothetical protein [Burkholderia gladioli]|uniref:hypothetical protein n=1 Tax=Burkholderia gladioli TaxID=28095 RepID=UPI001640B91D|nr:hypothetical protein [Burkholderia gladioli]